MIKHLHTCTYVCDCIQRMAFNPKYVELFDQTYYYNYYVYALYVCILCILILHNDLAAMNLYCYFNSISFVSAQFTTSLLLLLLIVYANILTCALALVGRKSIYVLQFLSLIYVNAHKHTQLKHQLSKFISEINII